MESQAFQQHHLAEKLEEVRQRIARAARKSGRTPEEVTLVAVTKGHPVTVVDAALGLGLRDLGENRVEALEERVPLYSQHQLRWHMVGRLQRRKAPRLLGLCHLLHSVDSLRLAERLSRAAEEADTSLAVLAQVNVAGEDAKTGWAPAEAADEILALAQMPGLEVKGLMTMAPHTDEEAVLRESFRGLRELHEDLQAHGYPGTELSMGMSNDFEVAVEEGSTLVRLGTALFGERAR
ncbi:MAG: YggS family pyridoxal phosphate-dependent enzyme [Gemmatimonadota bacterium]